MSLESSFDLKFVKQDKAKILILFCLIALVGITIFIRLCFIYPSKKVRSYIAISKIEKRNSILTSDNDFVAISLKSKDLYLDPTIVIDKKRTIEILLKHFPNLFITNIENKLNKKRWILIQRFITKDKLDSLIRDGLIGIRLQDSYKRVYPDENLFSHTVGYSGVDGVGFAGLERYYNDVLYDRDILTSLNRSVQSIVRNELIAAIEKHQAKSAFAVIMNVNTGEIISSVSIPDYNPNSNIVKDAENMQNAITSSVLEVGSVFKLFTLAYALENGLSKDYKIKVKDGIRLESGKIIKDLHGKNDELNIEEIFFKSSNVGSGIIATMFGEKHYIQFLKEIGVFKKPNIDIPEAEIASPIFNKNDHSISRIVTTSYGYGVSMSPIHFLAVANGIVNDGFYVSPRFIKYSDPNSVKKIKMVSKETSKQVIEIANKVVTEGTAKLANINGYKICGKTGTSQKFDQLTKTWSEEKKFVSFLAIFPCSKPKYIMYLGVNEPKPTKENALALYANLYGGTVAAPLSSKIISIISPMLNIKTDKTTK
jgi:cell division protein FtsI (penicillin-binding protein 3)